MGGVKKKKESFGSSLSFHWNCPAACIQNEPFCSFLFKKRKENEMYVDVGQGGTEVTRQDGQRALRGEKNRMQSC